MHIIIEGIYYCGKSTVIDQLQNRYGGYVHNTKVPPILDVHKKFSLEHTTKDNNFEDKKKYQEEDYPQFLYQNEYLKYVSEVMRITKSSLGYNVWYNRFHLSEYVYGYLYRQYTQNMMDTIFNKEIYYMKEACEGYNGIYLILLLMNHPENRKRNNKNISSNGMLEQSLFIEAFNKSNLPKSIIFTDTIEGTWRNPSSIALDIAKLLGMDKK